MFAALIVVMVSWYIPMLKPIKLYTFFFLVATHGLQDLSSPTSDWTWATAVKELNPNRYSTRKLPNCTL